MATPSKRRQAALAADRPAIQALYLRACRRFGAAQVQVSPSLLWTMRCIEGMQGSLPFQGGLVAQTASEVLWVWRTWGPGEEGLL